MSQSLVYILLLLALVLPVLGAIALRILAPRLTSTQLYSAAGGVLLIVLASVLLLERSDAPSLQIGSLSVLLPVTAPEDISVAVPVNELPTSGATLEAPTAAPEPALGTTNVPAVTTAPATASPAVSEEPTAAATAAATAAPTETAAPTAEPTVAPTAEPTAAPTAVPAPASEPQKYTVQAGDTLRSIAEQFNVSVTALVDANRLTPEEADSLNVGQELVIPAP